MANLGYANSRKTNPNIVRMARAIKNRNPELPDFKDNASELDRKLTSAKEIFNSKESAKRLYNNPRNIVSAATEFFRRKK